MKISSHYRAYRNSGFTLMELIIVISLIALLAGLSFGGYQMFIESSNYKLADGQMSALKSGVNDYRNDFSEPPQPASGISIEKSSRTLYQALWGDGDNALKIRGTAGTSESTGSAGSSNTPYITNLGATEGRMITRDYTLVDPFDQPYRYKVYDEDLPDENMRDKSPGGFDIWSYGRDSSENSSDTSKWVTSWK